MTCPRVLLILFDGAEWNIIHPLLRAGRLPRLAAFMSAASYSRLQSLEDVALASPILWTSLASGKLPHKHGVKDFYATAQSVRCVRLWEIFESEQLPIGLFRYLITWPPRPTNGFIIPDWCARTSETFPPELSFVNTMSQAKDWRSLIRHGAHTVKHGMRLSTALEACKEALRARLVAHTRLDVYFSQRLVELAIHADVFRSLVRRHRPYFAAFYTGLPDAVQHQYWKFMEPQKFSGVAPGEVQRYGGVIPRVYEELDRTLGRLLGNAGPETLVVIASDHGGEANIQEEYRWAFLRGEEFIKALGLTGVLSAFRIGARTYFRLRKTTPTVGTIADVAERVRAVTVVRSGTAVFRVEAHSEDEMSVEVVYLKEAMEGAELRFPDGRQLPVENIFNLTPTISGGHSMHGILLLRGPHVRKGREISGAGLLDVTPTILALLGRPVGQDMDGRVLTDAIEPEFLRHQPVQFIESYESLLGKAVAEPIDDSDVGLDEVKERLRALGYLE